MSGVGGNNDIGCFQVFQKFLFLPLVKAQGIKYPGATYFVFFLYNTLALTSTTFYVFILSIGKGRGLRNFMYPIIPLTDR
jgi:hypothetical protein